MTIHISSDFIILSIMILFAVVGIYFIGTYVNPFTGKREWWK
jgi:hypothetical protein